MRFLALLLLSAPGAAQPLTEAQALAAAMERPQVQARVQRAGDAARAEGRRQALWSNPELAFERAELPGSEVEHSLVITQDFDISGRRSLWAEAAARRVDAAEQVARAELRALRFEVRRRFAEVVYRQARHAALVGWEARLAAAHVVVGKREAAGDVSALEWRRSTRVLARARSDRAVAEVEREAAWQRLAALTGMAGQDWPRVVDGDGAALAIEHRHDIEAHTRLAESARLEVEAAQRAWIPGLALHAGWQARAENATTHGYVVGLALKLPLFDRGQADEAAARAVEADAEQQRTLAFNVAEGERVAARARWQALAAEAQRFAAENVKDSEEIARIAEAAYAGGELVQLELLDAWAAAQEDALHALELAHLARLARIEAEEVGP